MGLRRRRRGQARRRRDARVTATAGRAATTTNALVLMLQEQDGASNPFPVFLLSLFKPPRFCLASLAALARPAGSCRGHQVGVRSADPALGMRHPALRAARNQPAAGADSRRALIYAGNPAPVSEATAFPTPFADLPVPWGKDALRGERGNQQLASN